MYERIESDDMERIQKPAHPSSKPSSRRASKKTKNNMIFMVFLFHRLIVSFRHQHNNPKCIFCITKSQYITADIIWKENKVYIQVCLSCLLFSTYSTDLWGDWVTVSRAQTQFLVDFLLAGAAETHKSWDELLSPWMYGYNVPTEYNCVSGVAASTHLKLELPISWFLSGCGAEYGERNGLRACFHSSSAG